MHAPREGPQHGCTPGSPGGLGDANAQPSQDLGGGSEDTVKPWLLNAWSSDSSRGIAWDCWEHSPWPHQDLPAQSLHLIEVLVVTCAPALETPRSYLPWLGGPTHVRSRRGLGLRQASQYQELGSRMQGQQLLVLAGRN